MKGGPRWKGFRAKTGWGDSCLRSDGEVKEVGEDVGMLVGPRENQVDGGQTADVQIW